MPTPLPLLPTLLAPARCRGGRLVTHQQQGAFPTFGMGPNTWKLHPCNPLPLVKVSFQLVGAALRLGTCKLHFCCCCCSPLSSSSFYPVGSCPELPIVLAWQWRLEREREKIVSATTWVQRADIWSRPSSPSSGNHTHTTREQWE